MLTKCPECDLQVSDKAISCPHCGYPLVPTVRKKLRGRPRRLPNGFGRITKISNQNLRNPYRVMVTIGKTSEGRPVSRILKPKGYFKTYNEAYTALVEYNRNPYDLSKDITVEELYDKWSEKYFEKVHSSIDSTKAAWNYCSEIKGMRVADLRARHIKYCMNEGKYKSHTAPTTIKTRIKILFNLMLDYAVEYEIVDRNYARTFSEDSPTETHRHHIIFTDQELEILWQNLDMPYVDVLLIQCYSGLRPQEIGLIKISNVDLEKGVMVGGMKTDAGTNRTIPIHPKIEALVKFRYKNAQAIGSEYLINCTNNQTHIKNYKMTYHKYKRRFDQIIEDLGFDKEHKPHDGRKTFVTMAKRAEVDEYAIKYIIGHVINDLTEEVYTERSVDWLIDEIKKI